jgi:hypothetical protein
MDNKALATPTALDLPLSSAALRRLIDEVAGGQRAAVRGYNRTHNRHNR